MSYALVRKCRSCGTGNRIPARHLADTGRCGSCKAPLPPLDEPVDVDESAFAEIVQSAKVPVLADFWAEWCGPCRMAAPEVKELAREMAGRAVVLKVNTEQQPRLASQFRVQSIPNFVVLNGGRVVMQQPGFAGRAQMRAWLEGAFARSG